MRLIASIEAFIDMLNEMRLGALSQSTISAFRKLDRRVVYDDGIEPTELCVVFTAYSRIS